MDWTRAENIADRIDDLKKALGIRHNRELAERAGVGKQQVGAWIRGQQRPSQSRLASWAKREGWPISIFEEGGPMPHLVVNGTVNTPSRPTDGEIGAALEVLVRAIQRPVVPPPDLEARHKALGP